MLSLLFHPDLLCLFHFLVSFFGHTATCVSRLIQGYLQTSNKTGAKTEKLDFCFWHAQSSASETVWIYEESESIVVRLIHTGTAIFGGVRRS